MAKCPHCRINAEIKRERMILTTLGKETFYNSYVNYCPGCNNEFNTSETISKTRDSYKRALQRARKEVINVH